MVRLLRVFGFLLIAAGSLILVLYLIVPLRRLWPLFRMLPLPIQIGLGVALAGFLLLVGTMIWERLEEREADKALREDLDPKE